MFKTVPLIDDFDGFSAEIGIALYKLFVTQMVIRGLEY
jgi:hypothetical protein